MGKTASRPTPRTSFYTTPMNFECHYFRLGNILVSFVGLSGIVPADGADGEAISRSLEGNSFADGIKPDGVLRRDRASERGIHIRYCTSKSRDGS